jgi:glycerol kinase
MAFILALDQGTTGTTAALVDGEGRILHHVNKEHPQIYPQPGWVEHDPELIWASVVQAFKELGTVSGSKMASLRALGLTNQRETVVLWERATGRPVHNAIVWQCRRTTEFCEKLKRSAKASVIRRKTGLVVDPYFSASKIRWLLDHVPGARARARRGELLAGTIDSFLLFRLTGGQVHATDVTNASRTQLFNIHTGAWDDELLKIFNVPRNLLPEVRDSNGLFGHVARVAASSGLPEGLPIHGVAGDQQAALFGQLCFKPGMAKCTFGTGSFMLMNTGPKPVLSKSGLLTTVAWRLAGDKKMTYALEGGAFMCGAIVQWLRDGLKLIRQSADVESLARQVTSTEGVVLVPAFVGLGAPHWRPQARAALLGMTRGTSAAHVARAALQAMAWQNVDVLQAMQKDAGRRLSSLRVDGGAVRNDLLMQMQADALGVRVERPEQIESTVLGAALLAGLGCGLWPNLQSLRSRVQATFAPKTSAPARRAEHAAWTAALKKV